MAVTHRISYFIQSQAQAISSLDWISLNRVYTQKLVGWEFPPPLWTKCNVDASFQEEGNLVGCGGCFRDSTGKWITGFIRRLGRSSVNMEELWGIYIAIIQAKSENFSSPWIESDSHVAVSLVNKGCSDYHPCRQLVHSIRSLMIDHGHIVVSHVYREANRCADALARTPL
ncbi:Ribonuclease H-like superfamily [Sesbania bispinosa]|nr:Ribonuclease H-like superfamily [Sesbania bispinosa]